MTEQEKNELKEDVERFLKTINVVSTNIPDELKVSVKDDGIYLSHPNGNEPLKIIKPGKTEELFPTTESQRYPTLTQRIKTIIEAQGNASPDKPVIKMAEDNLESINDMLRTELKEIA